MEPRTRRHTGLAICGDDETTSSKEGMQKGEHFNMVLFDKSENATTALKVNRWERGDDVFAKDGVSVVGAIATIAILTQEMELFQNVPNPVVSKTSIGFFIP